MCKDFLLYVTQYLTDSVSDTLNTISPFSQNNPISFVESAKSGVSEEDSIDGYTHASIVKSLSEVYFVPNPAPTFAP